LSPTAGGPGVLIPSGAKTCT